MSQKCGGDGWLGVLPRNYGGQALDDGFAQMSYVLFRNDHDEREILAARVPDASLAVGSFLSGDPLLDAEALEYLNRTGGVREPLVVCTDRGVGVLSKVYDGCAALGLYLHLHLPAEPVARLINSGVLEGSGADRRPACTARVYSFGCEVREEDAPYYPLLAAWWDDVRGGRRLLPATSPQSHYRLHTDILAEAICRLASFVGCEVTVLPPVEWGESGGDVTCYNAELVEACLLFLLSEVRERAATRSATVSLESVSGERGGGMRLTVRYSVAWERKTPSRAPRDLSMLRRSLRRAAARVAGDEAAASASLKPMPTAGFSHMAQVAELCGLELYSTFGDARSAGAGESENLYDCTVVLEWLRDPTVLSTSDLKSRLRLAYGE